MSGQDAIDRLVPTDVVISRPVVNRTGLVVAKRGKTVATAQLLTVWRVLFWLVLTSRDKT